MLLHVVRAPPTCSRSPRRSWDPSCWIAIAVGVVTESLETEEVQVPGVLSARSCPRFPGLVRLKRRVPTVVTSFQLHPASRCTPAAGLDDRCRQFLRAPSRVRGRGWAHDHEIHVGLVPHPGRGAYRDGCRDLTWA